MKPQSPPPEPRYDELADALAEKGYCILPDLFPPALIASLRERVMRLDDAAFQQAGIGRELDFQLNTQVRRDEIRWLDQTHPVDAAYLAQMSELRLAINRRLFLGLFDYEAHYAHYPPGAFYKRHVDAFHGESNRVLTTVLYLNPDWVAHDGGQLLIYDPEDTSIIELVSPQLGLFVCFLSEDFPHEVVKSARDRYSIAGWFRVLDPLQAPIL